MWAKKRPSSPQMCIRDRYKAFLKNKYDLCVFDVMMPQKDGFTLAQEVRAANAEIPIIFLTAKKMCIRDSSHVAHSGRMVSPFLYSPYQ